MDKNLKIANFEDETLLSKNEFIAKIDKSIKEMESGKRKKLTKYHQKRFLGL